MTVGEAITYVDTMKPNQYTQADKIHWLNNLDQKLIADVFLEHVQSDYTEDDLEEPLYDWTATGTALTTVLTLTLVVPDPWSLDIYNNYLQSMIDKENGETAKYNNSATFFEQALTEWTGIYNRKNRPIYRQGYRF